jgi:hypothetical protein
MRHAPPLAAALAAALLLAVLRAAGAAADDRYAVLFDARIVPTERAAHVAIRLGEGARHLHSLRFRIDPERHVDFEGPGALTVKEDTVEWQPPEEGGTLRYVFRIDHLRDERSYDARCAANWALFRGDDLVPPARVRFSKGARSVSKLRLRLPEGWSSATPYPRTNGGDYEVQHPDRSFDRPTGWMVMGDLGVVREEVAGVKVAIAGPRDHGLRRQDILALLRWTMPYLRELLPLPDRLLVASAGDPMWRGGLSGPASLFLHADRPLISEDGTSPILHELIHSVMRVEAKGDGDWVVEGIAELYSLEVLRRSGTISEKRFAEMLERNAREVDPSRDLREGAASGAAMAQATTVLHELDVYLRSESDGGGLDEVVRALAEEGGAVTTARFRELAERVTGMDLSAFFARNLPSEGRR